MLDELRAALQGGDPLVDGPLDGWEKRAVLGVPTSGSTGEPKTVLLDADALTTSAQATHERLGGPGTWLLALPTDHIAGVQVLVRSIVAGTDPGVLDMSKGFRAMGFAHAARPVLDEPGRHYTALVPTQLSRLVVGEGPGLEALRQFDGVLIGGAATPPKLLEQARALGVQVVTTYGMSETAGGCVYDGEPLRDVSLRTDDVIEISGPVLALGYRGSAEPFGEWFRTGDLGRLREGRLEVLGRADDVIVTGGEKVPPVLVERALATVEGVLEACVVGIPDDEWGQVVAAVVVARGEEPSVDDLKAAVTRDVSRAAAPKLVRFVSELPLRGPGKVDRTAVANAFRS
ncbi:o-succinylbenzoate--CoA ligase [Lentzea sp. NBC_00516]|uniref:o-succinylbenzoate--CoA ligase n=1 Tax=Lentzea sp. NBC_00516 TaxID=2903582 RepID=UPI002E80110B|nr:o-succinylbenzoate--CoA ligase [Lentzea sp. NBC_00516]WUD23303.1 o-succinylbenzoate--CoA ligase [Lentzea sp. NBC_00516]